MFLFSSQKFTKDRFNHKADYVAGHMIDVLFISIHIPVRLSTDYCEIAGAHDILLHHIPYAG